MLSYEELLGAIKQLKTPERLALIEAAVHMVKEDLHHQPSLTPSEETPSTGEAISDYVPFIRPDLINLNEELLQSRGTERRGVSSASVLGMGWSATIGLPPGDDEIKEDYLNYLQEKYS